MGIHAREIRDSLYVVHRGEVNGREIHKVEYRPERDAFTSDCAFVGLPAQGQKFALSHKSGKVELRDLLVIKSPKSIEIPNSKNHLLVSSRYSIDSLPRRPKGFLWGSGVNTMKLLAKRGFWVHGCADGMGEGQIAHYLDSLAIKAMTGEELDLLVLSNADSTSDYGQVLDSYQREVCNVKELPREYINYLKRCTTFFWTSYFQYDAFVRTFPFIKDKVHASGPGKSYCTFKQQGVDVEVFASIENFRNWVNSP